MWNFMYDVDIYDIYGKQLSLTAEIANFTVKIFHVLYRILPMLENTNY